MNYKRAKNLGIVSFVLGIISLICITMYYFMIFAIVISIVGIILGVEVRKVLDKKDGKLALVGIICSLIGLMKIISGFILVEIFW